MDAPDENWPMKTELEGRTLDFAVAAIRYVEQWDQKIIANQVIGRQLLRAACSIGANYREANRAESKADFIHKVGISEKEASEVGFWLQVCKRTQRQPLVIADQLCQESGELLAILCTIGRKAKLRKEKPEAEMPNAGGESSKESVI